PVTYDSPFGRVSFQTDEEARGRDRVRALLDAVPGRPLFSYPCGAAFYLETGATNPTPFQVMTPAYSRPEHFAEVMEILDREPASEVLVTLPGPLGPRGPYVARNYVTVTNVAWTKELQAVLLRRRPAGGDSSPRSGSTREWGATGSEMPRAP